MTASQPDPVVRTVLAERKKRGIPPFSELSVADARRLLAELWAPPADREPVVAVRDETVDGPGGDLPIRIYTPDGSPPFPILVYCHGGGWVLGSLETDDGICRALTNAANCVVVSVAYRLAPEHPFPAAVEDCYAVAERLAEIPELVDGDPNRIAVGGESAGGTVAAAVAQLVRDRGGPALVHQVLVYAPTDRSFETASYDQNPEWLIFTKADIEWSWDHYLESDLDDRNPYAAPLRACDRDLRGLPSATILSCGFDVLRDEGDAYADRLADAGVRVDHRQYGDLVHGFIGMLDEPALPQARDAIAAIGRDLCAAFDRTR